MSSNSPLIEWDAIARYLAGESPAAEREIVQRWLASRPADAEMLMTLDDVLGRATLGSGAPAGIDVEAALVKVKARARASAVKPIRRTAWQMPAAIAAALLIAVGSFVARGLGPSAASPTIAARDFTTPVGGRDSLVLPDGSQVILGPGSRLTIAAEYGSATRSVAVHGEAYFSVKHDVARPFIVSANGATIRDLGTTFVVHSDSSGRVRVVVTSGTVALERTAAPAVAPSILHAGDIGTMSADGSVVAAPGAGSDDDLAWTRGKLVFRDAALADVRDDVRRWYGIELVVADSALLRRSLTASFDPGPTQVETVLRVIGLALDVKVDRRGDTAFVRPTPEITRRK